MAEATGMLVDHGRLGGWYFSALDRIFRNADPFFLLARPVPRPTFVPPISERAESKYCQDMWTTRVTTHDAATHHLEVLATYGHEPALGDNDTR